jgi:hypothetical protein
MTSSPPCEQVAVPSPKYPSPISDMKILLNPHKGHIKAGVSIPGEEFTFL